MSNLIPLRYLLISYNIHDYATFNSYINNYRSGPFNKLIHNFASTIIIANHARHLYFNRISIYRACYQLLTQISASAQ